MGGTEHYGSDTHNKDDALDNTRHHAVIFQLRAGTGTQLISDPKQSHGLTTEVGRSRLLYAATEHM